MTKEELIEKLTVSEDIASREELLKYFLKTEKPLLSECDFIKKSMVVERYLILYGLIEHYIESKKMEMQDEKEAKIPTWKRLLTLLLTGP